jgi:hypothetical protein
MVPEAARRDNPTIMFKLPFQRSARPPLPVDDAYSAWFNAQQRCTVALRAWSTAPRALRAHAHRAYLVELEDMAAAELERLHGQRLAA